MLLLTLLLLLLPSSASSNSTVASPNATTTSSPSNVSVFSDSSSPTPTPTVGIGLDSADVKDMVFFTLQFGFDEGRDREPTQQEVEELLCITTSYINWNMENYTKMELKETQPIQSFAVNVDWSYQQAEHLAIAITFFADITYAVSTQQQPLDKGIILDAFELTVEQLTQYIMEWVWLVSSDSVFYNTMRVNYSIKRSAAFKSGKLKEPDCDITRVPTVTPLTTSPTILVIPTAAPSALPSISPTAIATANATSTAPTIVQTLPPQQVQQMVYFQMQLLLDQPFQLTDDHVQTLLCKTNTFFQQKLATPPVQSTATNIGWVTSVTDNRSSVTIVFTSNTTYQQDGAPPVPMDKVRQAVIYAGHNQDLLLHLKGSTRRLFDLPDGFEEALASGGDNVFQQNDGPALLRAATNVTLEALPAGTPVRVGMLPVAECPETETAAPNRSTHVPNQTGLITSAPAPVQGGNSDNNGSGDNLNGGNNDTGPDSGNGLNGGDNQTGTDGSDHPDGTNGSDGSDLPNSDSNNSTALNDNNPNGGNDSENDGTTGATNSPNSGQLYPPPTIPITVDFIVSNLVGLEDPDDIIEQGGLSKSWPVLVQDLVQSLRAIPPTSRRLRTRRLSEPHRNVQYQPQSANIISALKTSCGPYVHPDSVCHQVQAKYDVFVTQVTARAVASQTFTPLEQSEIQRVFQVGTYKAINDGTYFSVLRRLVPDSPLIIGTIPMYNQAVDEDDGIGLRNTDWLMIILLIIVGTVCCAMVLAICVRWCCPKRNKVDDSERNQDSTVVDVSCRDLVVFGPATSRRRNSVSHRDSTERKEEDHAMIRYSSTCNESTPDQRETRQEEEEEEEEVEEFVRDERLPITASK